MSFFKKKLTEQEAASHFVLYIIKEAQDAWPTIHKQLKESFREKFQKDIQNIKTGGDPLSTIPARLLQRWLGKNIQNFDVEMNGKKTGIISPVFLMMVSSMLVAFAGTWKKRIMTSDIELVE